MIIIYDNGLHFSLSFSHVLNGLRFRQNNVPNSSNWDKEIEYVGNVPVNIGKH